MIRSPLPALLVLALAACDVGGVGPGGDDDGSGGGDDDDDGAFVPPDAAPDPVICSTRFVAGGDVVHEIPPVAGVSSPCDGAGTWSVALGEPTADEDGHETCGDAPADESFVVQVAAVDRDPETNVPAGYQATDDQARTWEVNVADKSGSCSGTFVLELDGGAAWSWHVTENGPDAATAGQGSYEVRDDGA